MRFNIAIAAALLLVQTQAVSIKTLDPKPMLSHNTSADDQYLTKVFSKFAVLGTDESGEPNGKRVLTKFNALNAAREIIGTWKNLSGQQLDDYLDARFDAAWHTIEASQQETLDVRSAYYWVRQLAGEEYYSG